MSSFTTRHILTIQTIGERLQKAREGANMTRAQIAHTVSIRAEYLAAIEEGRYSELPGDVYALEYIKKYARFLHIDPYAAAESYRLERLRARRHVVRHTALSRIGKRLSVFTQRIISVRVIALASVALGLVVTGSTLVLTRVFASPTIAIITPQKVSVTRDPHIIIQGKAENARAVYMNGAPIALTESGDFSLSFVAPKGVHVYTMRAEGVFGKSVTTYLSVRVGDTPT